MDWGPFQGQRRCQRTAAAWVRETGPEPALSELRLACGRHLNQKCSVHLWALLMSLLGLTLGGAAARELAPDPYAASQLLAPNPYVGPNAKPGVLALAPTPYGRPRARRNPRREALPLAAMPYAGSVSQAQPNHVASHPALLAPSPYELTGQRELAPLPY